MKVSIAHLDCKRISTHSELMYNPRLDRKAQGCYCNCVPGYKGIRRRSIRHCKRIRMLKFYKVNFEFKCLVAQLFAQFSPVVRYTGRVKAAVVANIARRWNGFAFDDAISSETFRAVAVVNSHAFIKATLSVLCTVSSVARPNWDASDGERA